MTLVTDEFFLFNYVTIEFSENFKQYLKEKSTTNL
jgi:hypothetical protein